jgi:RNA polymerase sigma-70 factor (ECF subfamily)
MTTADSSARAAQHIALLLAKHGDELARHIRRLVRDDDAAQDILQDTMIRAHGALSRLAADSNERAWLYRIATNASLNHLRSRTREREALRRHAAERETAAEPHADGRQGRAEARRAALWAHVARLPARQRLALTLRIVDELDYEEIARRVGGSAATARANVYQATKKLRLGVEDAL